MNKAQTALCVEYEAWQTANNLNIGSADDYICDESLSAEQRQYLVQFCQRWDAAE